MPAVRREFLLCGTLLCGAIDPPKTMPQLRPLLVAQRNQRIDTHRARCRDITREHRDRDECKWICSAATNAAPSAEPRPQSRVPCAQAAPWPRSSVWRLKRGKPRKEASVCLFMGASRRIGKRRTDSPIAWRLRMKLFRVVFAVLALAVLATAALPAQAAGHHHRHHHHHHHAH